MMFIFLILAIGAVALFLWWFRSGNVSGRSNFLQQNEDSSLEIVNRRYAQGEIDREQYEEMRKNLLSR
jgi:putative membrane protein